MTNFSWRQLPPDRAFKARSIPSEPLLYPRRAIEQSIPERFEEQVREHAGRIALVADGIALSYDQLNRAVNHLAAQILDATGQQEETVVLLMRQGAPFVVAVLGALKAGKIYVPLDPDDPETQIAAMAADSAATVVLTDVKSRTTAARLVDGGVKLLLVEVEPTCNVLNPDIEMLPGRPAYIYYTSGSTGRPKGVVDTHRNVLHNVMRYTNTLNITASDRLTLLQGPRFSGVVSSLFSALLNGAAIYPYDLRAVGMAGLAEWIQEHSLTMYHSVPSIFRAFVAGAGQFPSIRVVRLEGDQASAGDVDLFRQHFSKDCILVNGLGTTETGLCRQFFVDHSTHIPPGSLPVGYPVEDMEVLLLDDRGDVAGPGQTGEIAVRSNYLARGYWRRTELTEARFPRDAAGERFYRTGDVGRWISRDCLLHLGRLDSSLKIRGLRVDLGEVENALQRVDGVRQTVVTAHGGEDEDNESYLVGHVVRDRASNVGGAELRKRLGTNLPSYMVPSEIVFHVELPVTPQGKVDRGTLGRHTNRPSATKSSPLQPRTATETRMAAIWSSLLRQKIVSIDDSFFEIGGHSLLAMRMLVEIERQWGRRLAPGVFVEAPTVRRLAKLIDEPAAARSLITFGSHAEGPPLVCLPGADGDVLVFRQLAGALGPGVRSFAFEPPGVDGRSDPLDRVEAMADRYLSELLDACPTGPFCLVGYCFGGFVAYEMARQIEDRGYEVPLLALLDCDGEWRTISGWRDSVRYHVRNLRHQNLPERLAYLAERLSFRWRETADSSWRAVAKVLPVQAYPSARQGVIEAARRASRGYMPPKRSREVIYLRSRQRRYADPSRFWGNHVAGIDIREIEGSDATLFTEPEVSRLADLLRVLVRDANAGTTPQPPAIAATK